MTNEEKVVEYLKCKESFLYFCPKYIKIEMPGGDIPLTPYSKQAELIEQILRDYFVIVLKSRQIGISTILKAFCAWLTVFYDNVVIGIVSKDGPEASDFGRDITSMIDKLPVWMKPKFSKRRERQFILDNGSKCYCSPVAPNSPDKTLRGKGITFLLIDEAAFIKYIDIAWTAMSPALSTSQAHARKNNIPYGTVILSTPNKTTGVGRWYFNRFTKALNGNSIFKYSIIYWREIPELADDPKWYSNVCDLLDNDKKKIDQELELKFLPAEGSFFDPLICGEIQENSVEPMEKVKITAGEIWKYQNPAPKKQYLIGVDTAPEFGHDHSAIEIFDYETMEQVWEFQGKCKVENFCEIVYSAAITYPGIIIVENNSYGNQVVEYLISKEMSLRLYKEPNKKQYGLSTNIKTRPLMLNALYHFITNYPELIKSKRLALEISGLEEKNNKIEAEAGGFDDLVMASAFCFYVRKYDPPKIFFATGSEEELKAISDIVALNDPSYIPYQTNKDLKEIMIKKYLNKKENGSKFGYINILDILK